MRNRDLTMKEWVVMIRTTDGDIVRLDDEVLVGDQDAVRGKIEDLMANGFLHEQAEGTLFIPPHTIHTILVQENQRIILPGE